MTQGAKHLSVVDFCFALALASLFSGLFYDTGFVRLRPFEVLAFICVTATLWRYSTRFLDIPVAFWGAAAFLVGHALSAFSLDTANGLREALQVTEILSFSVAFLVRYRDVDVAPMLRALAVMALLVMAYAAFWHIQAGYHFGWKRIGDPKTAFLLVPVIASALFRNEKGRASLASYAILVAAMLFVFFSGERKAYLVALGALVLIFGLTNMRLLAALGMVMLFAAVAAVADPEGYLAHQVRSITAPDIAYNWVTLTYSDTPASLSNAQRAFASQLVGELVRENPVFGVGTNAYVNIVANRFWFLPDYLRTGVHNEFYRVLVENGFFGLSLYIFAWAMAAWRLAKNTDFTNWWRGMRGQDRTRVIFFMACLCLCLFEASKTVSLLALVFATFAEVVVPPKRKSAMTAARRFGSVPHDIALGGRPS